MDKQGVIYYFTKDEVEYIRNQIALKFDWTDKVMNKLDDFFDYFAFPENSDLQITGKINIYNNK